MTIKCDVPNPETCKSLLEDDNFYEVLYDCNIDCSDDDIEQYPNTYWVWLKREDNEEWFLSSVEIDDEYYGGYSVDDIEYVLPAPQISEIITLLSKITLTNKDMFYIGVVTKKSTKQYLQYSNLDSNEIFEEVEIKNNFYAQAYLEMYLKIKNKIK